MSHRDDIETARTQLADAAAPAPSAAVPFEGPAVLAGRYEVEGLLGMGGMGRVYRVRDRKLDETVALKMLRAELVGAPGILERFHQEVKLARRVTSPHVVRTFDLAEDGDATFLTMEYVEGRSLARRCEIDGALPIDEVLRIARAVCAGVGAAHDAGVVHRDLKPDNVLLGANGRVAITDFGIAGALQSPENSREGHAPGEGFVGTPAYMAPEQVRGDREVTAAADVYALGALFFEMLTGRRPFPGDDPYTVAVARLHQPPPDPRAGRAVPDDLAELVLRCLAREPRERFPDARALAAAIQALGAAPATVRSEPSAMPVVPARSARAVAVLPLRCDDPELAEVAEGLGEEIVDALSCTRGLRVRPLDSVRSARDAEQDPQAAGKRLGVDVVVLGSLRRATAGVRLAGRAIGVEDGFQLWATRVDCATEGLLAACDQVARAIAAALTVEIEPPARAPQTDPRAALLYLEGKHKLRTLWATADVELALPPLLEALRMAPDDAAILAAASMAHARTTFFSSSSDAAEHLDAARSLAAEALAKGPTLGEPWMARGVAALYAGDVAEAGAALFRAVVRAPGLAIAQAMLGALLSEAGAVDDAIAHLAAAAGLDPTAPQPRVDLARTHALAGHVDTAEAILRDVPLPDLYWRFARSYSEARFRSWRGATTTLDAVAFASAPDPVRSFTSSVARVYESGTCDAATLQALLASTDVPNPRFRAVRCQYTTEVLLFAGENDAALRTLEKGIAAGLQDRLWLDRCPLLDKLRARSEFAPLRAELEARATAVLAAIAAARAAA